MHFYCTVRFSIASHNNLLNQSFTDWLCNLHHQWWQQICSNIISVCVNIWRYSQMIYMTFSPVSLFTQRQEENTSPFYSDFFLYHTSVTCATYRVTLLDLLHPGLSPQWLTNLTDPNYTCKGPWKQALGTVSDSDLTACEKTGPQSYNLKERNCSNDLKKLGCALHALNWNS